MKLSNSAERSIKSDRLPGRSIQLWKRKLKHVESTERRVWLAALAIVVLVPAIGMGFRIVEKGAREPPVEEASWLSLSGKPSIAVLPFANRKLR